MEMQQPQQGRQLETSGVNLAAAVFLIGMRDEIKKSEHHLRVLENQSTEMVVRVQAISISQQYFIFMPNEIPH